MPAKSEAQRRFMEGVAHGSIKRKSLSPDEAEKFLHHGEEKQVKLRKPHAGKAEK